MSGRAGSMGQENEKHEKKEITASITGKTKLSNLDFDGKFILESSFYKGKKSVDSVTDSDGGLVFLPKDKGNIEVQGWVKMVDKEEVN